jgi:hypothetical protein
LVIAGRNSGDVVVTRRMARLTITLVLSLWFAGCGSSGMKSFSLPPNLAVVPPGPGVPVEVAALSGAWSGIWLTPGWGPGYEGLLVVEHIDRDEATVLYAWGNHTWFKDDGWYRQKARVTGSRLEWTRGKSRFSFDLDKDGKTLSGEVRDDSPEYSFVVMKRVPVEPSQQPAAPPARPLAPTLPVLPVLNIIPPAPDLPAPVGRFLGVWEGTWDSGVAGRLVVWGINRATAMVVYAWSDDPAGGFKADYMKRVAVVYEDAAKITWGGQPRFTFRLGTDQTLHGEWERDGYVSAVTMSRAKQ